ncbi:hypothetical protein Sipo8835_12695 [Streptomyces ipomoeae]|uniref:Lipoprotein n=2 Tax=Streptomyces ipomoeae TaxID=103232 RepID=L1L9A5_9ACTN|nr:hypothetical protein [Streptomyces ipomoeae]EKX69270.1 hypothetical protein STRIP9103_02405 [Streptomyces ipomoeae 91-03]MDX2699237.1 hypothetical protein [Streptomyces ipomoeae]MDX2826506.1 hypothetical protein [Streptomyces ipomoeae]MDX2844939.1 hypothetical protein [Streptomyces ipomoeae]MDX2879318.1 hypothetical protein [Streptomyces ipomoeae]
MAYRVHRWGNLAAVITATGLLTAGPGAPGAPGASAADAVASSAAPAPRIDLKVLVVDNGDSPVQAITVELRSNGIPYTRVNLNDPGRPTISPAFLSGTVDGTPRAKYQGVVLPNETPFGEGSPERAALEAYERTYGIPQVDAYTWAHPGVGLDHTSEGGWAGSLDGRTAAITDAGRAGFFGYLDGPVTFDDNSPSVQESYGFVARPREGYTSYLDIDVPDGSGRGSLVGEYAHDGRRELVVTFAHNRHQRQFRVLARGIVEWLTDGVHLGRSRNYFAVHVDDVFAPDSRWDTENDCTPGSIDCGTEGGEGTTPIRMTAADAVYARQWQQASGLTLDLVHNGGSGEAWKEANGGADALTDQLLADRNAFRWINHTYTHQYLGCVQDTSTVPWSCAKNADGTTRYLGRAEISAQIRDNHDWAVAHGLPVQRGELVTGEHSGLRTLPQQPDDNPNLAGALADNGVTWIASDDSREPEQRPVGAALTVPRHPMNVYYNVGTAAEMVDEYNWVYTSAADGGSGVCENDATSTCLAAPLDPATGYASHIVPQEARTALLHATGNDPRPHYAHQSNLAEDRLLYPVLDRVLADYRALYAADTPLENLRQSAIGTELKRRAAWETALAGGTVTAYRIGTTVTVTAPAGTSIPVTAPEGTQKKLPLGTTAFGTPYAGARSAWDAPATPQSALTLKLPA